MDDQQTGPVLQVEGLHVYYGAFHAVRDVSFDVQAGEIFGFLGPNGAGKTSTLSAIEGLLKPRSGNITVAGYDVRKQPLYARANMGIQLQATSFQPELTIAEIIRLYAGIYGVEMSKDKIDGILQDINLQDAGGKRFGQLSGGQQQRVSLLSLRPLLFIIYFTVLTVMKIPVCIGDLQHGVHDEWTFSDYWLLVGLTAK